MNASGTEFCLGLSRVCVCISGGGVRNHRAFQGFRLAFTPSTKLLKLLTQMAEARRILVTGANRGIGLAIVRRCLSDHIDTHVILACRRALAGGEAAAALIADRPDWKARLTVLEMDTSSDSSVIAAAAKLEADFGRTPLYGIVNNAGIASGARSGVVAARVARRSGL